MNFGQELVGRCSGDGNVIDISLGGLSACSFNGNRLLTFDSNTNGRSPITETGSRELTQFCQQASVLSCEIQSFASSTQCTMASLLNVQTARDRKYWFACRIVIVIVVAIAIFVRQCVVVLVVVFVFVIVNCYRRKKTSWFISINNKRHRVSINNNIIQSIIGRTHEPNGQHNIFMNNNRCVKRIE